MNLSSATLLQKLLQCQSITPQDAGCMEIIEEILTPLGFHCQRIKFNDVDNFYAKIGTGIPHICFLGHTDVVPTPNLSLWKYPPFSGTIEAQDKSSDVIYGRGAVDMKGAIACFIVAIQKFLAQQQKNFNGSISILLTSDEEGIAQNGIKKMIPWLKEKKEQIDFCLCGEPTNPHEIGEMIKIGRRGSLSFTLTIKGNEGHVAYPHNACNPISAMVQTIQFLTQIPLDNGNEWFDPSHLEITSIDANNPTFNMIPKSITASGNIRFSNAFTIQTLTTYLSNNINVIKNKINTSKEYINKELIWDLAFIPTGDAFINANEYYTNMVSKAIDKITHKKPIQSTTGGTSDARFMKDLCPVIEFGLTNATAHKINEYTTVSDLECLTKIYKKILVSFFKDSQ